MHFIILLLLLGFCPQLSAQKSKARSKEIAKYWKKEVKRANSTNHEQIARNYPDIGWLSGVWCKKESGEPKRSYEVLGKWEARSVTNGYTAESKHQIFFPETLPMGTFMDKPVVVENGKFYELWSYSGDGKGLYGPVWWVYMERIEKVSENEFKRVYATNYTHRKPTLDLAAFAQEESKKIDVRKHYKTPYIYVKCN